MRAAGSKDLAAVTRSVGERDHRNGGLKLLYGGGNAMADERMGTLSEQSDSPGAAEPL